MNVLRVFTVSVAFFRNFALFSKFPKTEKRMRKPVSVSQKTQVLNVFRSLALSVAFYSNLLQLPSFVKLKRNSHKSVSKNQNLNVLRNPTFSKRIPFQFCYLQHFEIKSCFILKNPSFFRKKQTLRVLRFFTFSVALYGKFATFSIFKYNQLF